MKSSPGRRSWCHSSSVLVDPEYGKAEHLPTYEHLAACHSVYVIRARLEAQCEIVLMYICKTVLHVVIV
jgi:hypothetical protein